MNYPKTRTLRFGNGIKKCRSSNCEYRKITTNTENSIRYGALFEKKKHCILRFMNHVFEFILTIICPTYIIYRTNCTQVLPKDTRKISRIFPTSYRTNSLLGKNYTANLSDIYILCISDIIVFSKRRFYSMYTSEISDLICACFLSDFGNNWSDIFYIYTVYRTNYDPKLKNMVHKTYIFSKRRPIIRKVYDESKLIAIKQGYGACSTGKTLKI